MTDARYPALRLPEPPESAPMYTATAAFPRLVLATVLAILPACSGSDPVPAAKELKASEHEPKVSENELAKLVPVGTAIYVQAPSIDRLATSIRNVMAAFDPDQAATMDVDEMLEGLDLPGSMKEIDRTKPLAVCLVLPAEPGAEPSPTFLVPALSPESFVRSVAESAPGLSTAVHGGYVAVSMAAEAKPGPTPAAIALDLPTGDVVARLDVQRLVEHFRPMIDMGLGQMTSAMESMSPQAMGGMAVGPFMKVYADGIRAVLDSGQTLDLALRLDGGILEIASVLTAREKSALDGFGSGQKTEAKALARFLDPRAPMSMVLGMDQAVIMQRLRPLIEATFAMYPEPMRSGFQKMMGSADELAAQLGSAMCVNGAFGSDGLRYACYLRPRDAAKLVETYRTMMTSVPGITFEPLKEGEVDGVPVLRSRLRVDAETLVGGQLGAAGEEQKAQMKAMFDRMYGANGLAFTFATRGDVTAIVMGGDDAFLGSSLSRLSSSDTLPPAVARGLEQVGDLNPCFVMRYDMGAMMQGMQDLLGDAAGGMPFGFSNLSASFTIFGGVDGRVWRGAMSTDIAELGSTFRAMMGGNLQRAEGSKTRVDLRSISSALTEYAIMNGGKYPESLVVLVVLDANGQTYLVPATLPKDPWGREYLYDPPSAERAKPRVYTYGRDGRPGGEGEDADLDDSSADEGNR